MIPRAPRGLLAGLAGLAALLGACGAAEPVGERPVERVLLVALPGVSWEDVEDQELPVLEAFIEDAAVGDLSTRIGRRGASTTDAYLTIGAGTRAVEPSTDAAVALDPDELYGGVPAAEILRRRLGEVPEGIAYLAAGAAADVNEASSFGAEPGRLGDLLDEASVSRGVVANADAVEGFVSEEPPPDGAYARAAATALMGSAGIVPGGTVGRPLLADDPLAPFGRRLSTAAVIDAFEAAWPDDERAVVLVEASDLLRAEAYRGRSTPEQGRALRQQALRDADGLLGDLLERTDPATDAVVVLSPVASRTTPELAIAALRAPGVEPGLLRSSTTRRDGYVQLADVAPTVLGLLGEPQPDDIEGRRFEVAAPSGEDRTERLIDGSDAAGFRDAVIAVVVTVITVALALLAVATALHHRIPAGARRWLPRLALGALGVVPATFLAPQVPGVNGNAVAYAVVVVAVAAALAALYVAIDRRWRGLGPIIAVAAVVALIAGDVLFGAALQVNAVFGYSLAVAGRFAGLGNLAFALFGAATVVLGALLVDRFGRPGLPLASALFALVVLVEGLPMLGADVGGVVSMVPAFGAAALVLWGRTPRWTDAAGLAVATAATVLLFAFIDVGRPEGSRTHLARLAEHVLEARWGPFTDSLLRRLEASFGGTELALWALVLGAIAGVAAYAYLAASGRVGPRGPRRRHHVPTRAAAVGLGVLAVVGLVANDSSIAVPATMLIVVVPVLSIRHLERAGAASA